MAKNKVTIEVKVLSVEERCRRYQIQDCSMCLRLDCCDNTNYLHKWREEKARREELERVLRLVKGAHYAIESVVLGSQRGG